MMIAESVIQKRYHCRSMREIHGRPLHCKIRFLLEIIRLSSKAYWEGTIMVARVEWKLSHSYMGAYQPVIS